MSEAAVIDVEGLTKSFGGRRVVDDFSIRVERGQIFGFLGPNGSGKTTTIRTLCGLLKPDGGRGTCLGHDILRESALIKREVGYMTQRFSLYEDLSIRENARLAPRWPFCPPCGRVGRARLAACLAAFAFASAAGLSWLGGCDEFEGSRPAFRAAPRPQSAASRSARPAPPPPQGVPRTALSVPRSGQPAPYRTAAPDAASPNPNHDHKPTREHQHAADQQGA